MRSAFLKGLPLALALLFCGCDRQESMREVADKVFSRAAQQCEELAQALDSLHTPRSFDGTKLITARPKWWCSGFFPGTLWLVYEYTGDEKFRFLAQRETAKVEPIKWVTTDHDVGFQINCSFGQEYRITGDPHAKEVMHTAARSLATRFNPTVGCIRSWDFQMNGSDWQFPVIIDNMMNLELLMRVAELENEPELAQVAVSHANTTLQNHYRPDFTTYHLVDYNPADGSVNRKQTVQGYADNSAWARGQAWSLYGFTMMYRFTRDVAYLDRATSVADMLLSRLPEDGIPYWDFDSPKIPDDYKDASAAAVMASAFVELAAYVDDGSPYLNMAERQLRTLSSDEYLAEPGTNGGFILKHSVGNIPGNSEVDVPLTYADYYFLEALGKYLASAPLELQSFKDLPEEISVETIGNRVAEQLLASDPLDYGNNLPGYQAPYNYGRGGKEMNYSVVSLWVNALEFARRSHNKELEKRLIDFFEPFYGERASKRNRDNHVDFSIFGAIPLEIYLMNGDKRALELGLRYADHQWEDPTGEPGEKVGGNGNFPIERQRELLAEGYSPQTRLWIDDMYMITVLQTQAYRATGNRKYIDRAAREMKMYMDSLQRENGLFYHAPEAPFFWGRGNGWMAAGLPMLLSYLPKDSEYRPALKDAYLKMMPTLLEYQHENGLWGQVIDDPEFWEETSCSAMFAYAFIEGVRLGLLDEAAYGTAARKAWVSLCGKLDEYANLADVCIGTDRRNSREWYMDRPRSNGDPHGQMAMMWLCNVLLK